MEPRTKLHRMFFGVILILRSSEVLVPSWYLPLFLQHSIASVLQKSADPQIKIANPSFLEPSFQSVDENAWFFVAENAMGSQRKEASGAASGRGNPVKM